MDKFDDEIKKLEIKKLKLEIEEIKKKHSFWKNLFPHILPSLIQAISIIIAGYVVLKSDYYSTVKENAELTKNKAEYETIILNHAKKQGYEKLIRMQKEYDRINASYAELDKKNDTLNRRYIESQTNFENAQIASDRASVAAKTAQIAYLNLLAEKETLSESVRIAKEHAADYYKNIKDNKDWNSVSVVIKMMSEDASIRGIYLDSIYVDKKRNLPISTNIYLNYILLKTEEPDSSSYIEFIDDVFYQIRKVYDNNDIIDGSIMQLLHMGEWRVKDILRIQKNSMEILSLMSKRDSLNTNYNNARLFGLATIAYYFETDRNTYVMYRESPDTFIDLLILWGEIMQKDNQYESDIVFLYRQMASLCPPYYTAMKFRVLRYFYEKRLTELKYYETLIGTDISTVYSYGSYAPGVINEIMMKYQTPESRDIDVDSVTVPNIFGYINQVFDNKQLEPLINRWLDSDMRYFKEHHDEMIDCIENRHL